VPELSVERPAIRLKRSPIAKSISAPAVYYSGQGGLRTHATQHSSPICSKNWSGRLSRPSFADLNDGQAVDRVTLLASVNPIRRILENAPPASDHCTPVPVFLPALAVQSRLVGTMPSLTRLEGCEPDHGPPTSGESTTVLE